MHKLQKAFLGISALIRQPYLLNLVLNHNDTRRKRVSRKYNLPRGLPVADFLDICGSKDFSLSVFAFLDGSSLPTDIVLLKTLATKFENCKYFEIGTWRGESVANVAEVATECYTLNLSKEEILASGMPEKYADLHAFFSKDLSNVKHLKGNSLSFDYTSLNQKFDLIFIDGDHHYESVLQDTRNVFEHLTHDNSIVVWHDYAYNPEHVRFEVMEAILDGTPPHLRRHLYHVSNTMCAVFYPSGEFKTTEVDFPSVPNKLFSIEANIREI